MEEKKSVKLFTILSMVVTACIFFFLGTVLASLLGPRFVVRQPDVPTNPTVSESVSDSIVGKIPLNSATAEQLMTISGIGAVYAQRIVEYREQCGGFSCLEELMNVKGIGESRYNEWVLYLTLD